MAIGLAALGFLGLVVQKASAADLPAWTYREDQVTIQDPINLVFYGASWQTIRDALINRGWVVVEAPLCQINEKVLYAGTWRVQDVGLAKQQTGCGDPTRLHIRLWQLETNLVIANAHQDHVHLSDPPHQVHDYEGLPERTVAEAMRLTDVGAWRVTNDELWMNNVKDYLHDGIRVYNNGWATVIRKQTGASAKIYNGIEETLLDVTRCKVTDADNSYVRVYAYVNSCRWALWYRQVYSSGTVAAGGSTTILWPHYVSWTLGVWSADLNVGQTNYMGMLFCRENDGNLGCITLLGRETGSVVNVADSNWEPLMTPGNLFVRVYDTGNPADNRRLWIASSGPTVEWYLWHYLSYSYGDVLPGYPQYATFPDAKIFMLFLYRMQEEDKYTTGDYVAILFCREDNNIPGCMRHTTGSKANIYDSTKDLLSQIGPLGGIRDTGDPSLPNTIEVYSNPTNVVEWAYWKEGVYTWGEAILGGTSRTAYTHYWGFVFTGSRYDKNIWLFCKENDGYLGCAPLRWWSQ